MSWFHRHALTACTRAPSRTCSSQKKYANFLVPFHPYEGMACVYFVLSSPKRGQQRFFKDCPNLACFRDAPPGFGEQCFFRELRTTYGVVELMWWKLWAFFPKKTWHTCTGQAVHVNDGTILPSKVERTLRLGPKFRPQPGLDKVEMSLVRSSTSRLKEEGLTQCVSEGIGAPPAILCLGQNQSRGLPLKDGALKLLCSYKEGGFAVLPSALYCEEATEAVLNDFKAAPDAKPPKLKKTLRLCEELALTTLASSVKKSPVVSPKIFLLSRNQRREALCERSSLNAALGNMSLGSFCEGGFLS
ncbi:hypothetical protein HPB48_001341 [Haemaphysalis longicornis]|uniref:Uncharacterized protein n=1 Tax=Haemaphysalis longicornis TaxID=44386 RepID=A0A9J6GU90_HAELO|nr:hypothetical protein HPB48_001341 [Haemaphysalis longicornis]